MRFRLTVALLLATTAARTPIAAADLIDRRITQDDSGNATVEVSSQQAGGGTSSGGTVACRYYETPVTDTDHAAFLAPAEMVEGSFYWIHCEDTATDPPAQLTSRYFQFTPGTPAISPLGLAERAAATLTLAYPSPSVNPPAHQLPGIDTWLWIDAADWQPVTAQASITGLSATVTATPVQVSWDPGDGSGAIVCDGPGTAYDPGRPPEEQSTDCRHTYQVRGTYTASATVTWTLGWSASDGSTGTLAEATRTTTFPVTVDERQAVG